MTGDGGTAVKRSGGKQKLSRNERGGPAWIFLENIAAKPGILNVAGIGRARGARCGAKTEFLRSNGGGGRNPGKPGFGWSALRAGQKPPGV